MGIGEAISILVGDLKILNSWFLGVLIAGLVSLGMARGDLKETKILLYIVMSGLIMAGMYIPASILAVSGVIALFTVFDLSLIRVFAWVQDLKFEFIEFPKIKAEELKLSRTKNVLERLEMKVELQDLIDKVTRNKEVNKVAEEILEKIS